MTKDEMMDLINRSLFATIGYADETGRQNVRRVLFEGLCLFGSFAVHFEREYSDGGRFYRYDGKGDLSASEIEAYDKGREFENGYDSHDELKA